MPTRSLSHVIRAVRVCLLGLLVVRPALAVQPDAPSVSLPEIEAVVTTGMIADVVRHVGGDRVRVRTLISPGVDPHLYKPTRADIARLMRADIIFYNGLLLEGKMTDTLVRAARTGRPVYAVTERVDPGSLLNAGEGSDHHDPHLWMDPKSWSLTIGVISDALAELDPDGADVYRQNADEYLARLIALHAYAERVLESVPKDQRILVTAHDAFGYLGARYGYEVVGIQGISTESEAGVRDIERLVELLVERKVAAVFVETTVSDRNVRALIAGAGARGWVVKIGGSLYSDAMGAEGSYEGTYIGMIDHNVGVIARSLGGEVPPGGFRGASGG